MSQGKQYYCSSPALDWRLSGRNTVQGEIRPDPLIYSTEQSINTLFQNTNPYTGLGKLPPLSSIPPEALERPRKVLNKIKSLSGNTSRSTTSTIIEKKDHKENSQSSTMTRTQDSFIKAESDEKMPSTPPSKGAARKTKSSLSSSPQKTSSPLSARKFNKWRPEEESIGKVS